MNLFALSGLLTVMTGLPIAIFVYWAGTNKTADRIWALFVFAVSGYGLATYRIALIQIQDAASALIWWRVSMFCVILIPVFFYHYIQYFLNQHNRKGLLWVYGTGIFFLILDLTSAFISKLRWVFGSFYYAADPTPLYTLFVLWLLVLVCITHFKLWKFYKSASGLQKDQIAYFFFATAIGFGGGITSFLPIFGVNFYPILNLAVPLYPIIMAYAIYRHQLFGVKVFATSLLTGIILLVLLFQIFFSGTVVEFVLRSLFFVVVLVFGILLVRTVLQEVRTREEIGRLAKDLETANKELKRLDQAKSEFISIASHQLRTPLSIIKGYISMIREGSYGAVSDAAQKTLNKIYLSNERLIKLVADLLDLSRMESGRMQYEFANFNINDLVDSTVDEFRIPARDKGLLLQWEKPSGALTVWGDSWKLRQVIFNLIDNSLKYTAKGSIEVSVKKDDNTVAIAVSDTGIGMDEETARSLFQKFARGGGDSSKINTQGLGLGLFIAKKIMDDHKGNITVASDGPGQGSTFTLIFPLHKS